MLSTFSRQEHCKISHLTSYTAPSRPPGTAFLVPATMRVLSPTAAASREMLLSIDAALQCQSPRSVHACRGLHSRHVQDDEVYKARELNLNEFDLET